MAAVVRKKQDDKYLKALRELVTNGPGNRQCFDCGQKGPTYVNMTIGSFVCTRCSGVLRGITPPHRVKSISMATFTQEEIDFLKSHGNELCAKTWLGLWDPKRAVYQDQRELMVDKYERKRFYLEPASPLKSLTSSTLKSSSTNNSITNGNNHTNGYGDNTVNGHIYNHQNGNINNNRHNSIENTFQKMKLTPPTSQRTTANGLQKSTAICRPSPSTQMQNGSSGVGGGSVYNNHHHQQQHQQQQDAFTVNSNGFSHSNSLNTLNGLSCLNGLNALNTLNGLQSKGPASTGTLSDTSSCASNGFANDNEFVADFGTANIFDARSGMQEIPSTTLSSNGYAKIQTIKTAQQLNGLINGINSNNNNNSINNNANNNMNCNGNGDAENFADFDHAPIYNSAATEFMQDIEKPTIERELFKKIPFFIDESDEYENYDPVRHYAGRIRGGGGSTTSRGSKNKNMNRSCGGASKQINKNHTKNNIKASTLRRVDASTSTTEPRAFSGEEKKSSSDNDTFKLADEVSKTLERLSMHDLPKKESNSDDLSKSWKSVSSLNITISNKESNVADKSAKSLKSEKKIKSVKQIKRTASQVNFSPDEISIKGTTEISPNETSEKETIEFSSIEKSSSEKSSSEKPSKKSSSETSEISSSEKPSKKSSLEKPSCCALKVKSSPNETSEISPSETSEKDTNETETSPSEKCVSCCSANETKEKENDVEKSRSRSKSPKTTTTVSIKGKKINPKSIRITGAPKKSKSDTGRGKGIMRGKAASSTDLTKNESKSSIKCTNDFCFKPGAIEKPTNSSNKLASKSACCISASKSTCCISASKSNSMLESKSKEETAIPKTASCSCQCLNTCSCDKEQQTEDVISQSPCSTSTQCPSCGTSIAPSSESCVNPFTQHEPFPGCAHRFYAFDPYTPCHDPPCCSDLPTCETPCCAPAQTFCLDPNHLYMAGPPCRPQCSCCLPNDLPPITILRDCSHICSGGMCNPTCCINEFEQWKAAVFPGRCCDNRRCGRMTCNQLCGGRACCGAGCSSGPCGLPCAGPCVSGPCCGLKYHGIDCKSCSAGGCNTQCCRKCGGQGCSECFERVCSKCNGRGCNDCIPYNRVCNKCNGRGCSDCSDRGCGGASEIDSNIEIEKSVSENNRAPSMLSRKMSSASPIFLRCSVNPFATMKTFPEPQLSDDSKLKNLSQSPLFDSRLNCNLSSTENSVSLLNMQRYTIPGANSNSTAPSEDRYAALKDLDEQFREHKNVTTAAATINCAGMQGAPNTALGASLTNFLGGSLLNPFSNNINPFQAQQQQSNGGLSTMSMTPPNNYRCNNNRLGGGGNAVGEAAFYPMTGTNGCGFGMGTIQQMYTTSAGNMMMDNGVLNNPFAATGAVNTNNPFL